MILLPFTTRSHLPRFTARTTHLFTTTPRHVVLHIFFGSFLHHPACVHHVPARTFSIFGCLISFFAFGLRCAFVLHRYHGFYLYGLFCTFLVSVIVWFTGSRSLPLLPTCWVTFVSLLRFPPYVSTRTVIFCGSHTTFVDYVRSHTPFHYYVPTVDAFTTVHRTCHSRLLHSALRSYVAPPLVTCPFVTFGHGWGTRFLLEDFTFHGSCSAISDFTIAHVRSRLHLRLLQFRTFSFTTRILVDFGPAFSLIPA